MLGQFIDATGSQKSKKLDHITYIDRAVLCPSFQISTKMRSYIVTSALSVVLYKHTRSLFYKQHFISNTSQISGKLKQLV